MHDIRFIRENREAFDAALARRGLEPVAKALIALDEERRALTTQVQVAQSRRNEASKLIGAAMAKGERETAEAIKAEVAALKDEMPALEARADDLAAKLKAALEIIPNLPGADVPDGGGEEDNVEVSRWGTPRAFDFTPKEHADIAPALGMDFETGARLSGADCVHVGLATHLVLRENFPALRAALMETGDASVIARFATPLPEASFAAHRALIDHAFAQESVLGIIAALEADGGEWALSQVKILRRMSPTSLSVSLELLKRGAGMNLRQCLDEELKLTRTVVHDHPDFREGVRSVLVDKDGTPNWTPATLEQVDRAAVLALFN
jgi:hypothetical protein